MSDDYDPVAEGIENSWLDEQNQRALESYDRLAEQGPEEIDPDELDWENAEVRDPGPEKEEE